jgi:hypothetical protein
MGDFMRGRQALADKLHEHWPGPLIVTMGEPGSNGRVENDWILLPPD